VSVERLIARLGDLGEVLDESRVVRKVLRAVPRRLKQVAPWQVLRLWHASTWQGTVGLIGPWAI
jgi:hypothetical protein